MHIQRIGVFCGSSLGNDPGIQHAAAALGQALARRGITLVYGGGNIGLMGVVADHVMSCGGNVIGVIPKMLVDKELAHHGITDLRIVGSMHERKALMAELADGYVALPGGFGTIEEFSEVLTWGQLGLHTKPMGILNVVGYFDHFLRFLDHAVQARLLRPEHRRLVLEAASVDDLLERLAAWHAEPAPKWIRPEET